LVSRSKRRYVKGGASGRVQFGGVGLDKEDGARKFLKMEKEKYQREGNKKK
jgi:hypothetical protein